MNLNNFAGEFVGGICSGAFWFEMRNIIHCFLFESLNFAEPAFGGNVKQPWCSISRLETEALQQPMAYKVLPARHKHKKPLANLGQWYFFVFNFKILSKIEQFESELTSRNETIFGNWKNEILKGTIFKQNGLVML